MHGRLSKIDIAIETMNIIRGETIIKLSNEMNRPKEERNQKLILDLRKELCVLCKEKELMDRGNEWVITKVLSVYRPKYLDQNFRRKNDGR